MMNVLKIAFMSVLLLLITKSNIWAQKKVFTIKNFKTCWQLKDMVYQSEGGSNDSIVLNRLTGTVICFNEDVIDILGDTIVRSKFILAKESTEKYIVRNFQVYNNIEKNFKIRENSLYVVKLLDGLSITDNPNAKIKRIKAYPYEFAYNGEFLFLPYNGGFFRFERYDPNMPDMMKRTGAGSTTNEFTLTGNETTIDLLYHFFVDADNLRIFDQTGTELYRSGMMGTRKAVHKIINIKNVTKLIFKIESNSPKSRWSFGFNVK